MIIHFSKHPNEWQYIFNRACQLYILTKDLSCCPELGVFTAGGCEGIWGLKGGVSGVFNISSRKLLLRLGESGNSTRGTEKKYTSTYLNEIRMLTKWQMSSVKAITNCKYLSCFRVQSYFYGGKGKNLTEYYLSITLSNRHSKLYLEN